jgi:adenylate kinase
MKTEQAGLQRQATSGRGEMNLILFGAPGAGKGTQGALLSEKHGLLRLSTGDLLRDATRQETRLGREAKEFMEAGELVPDGVILGMVREAMQQTPDVRGFIFDGFPRTVTQAEGLEALLEDLGRPLDAVIVLDVDDESIVRRLGGRLSCPQCAAVYNVHTEPPRVDAICDRCGATVVQRADDRPETVRRRLTVYRDQTAPLIGFYEAGTTPVYHIDGDRPIDQVQAELQGLLVG